MRYIWKFSSTTKQYQKEIKSGLKLSPFVIEVLHSRKITHPEDINNFFKANAPPSETHSPYKLKDLDKAVYRIIEAITNHEKIIIFGDYDVDGITSTALLYQFFQVISYYQKTNIDVNAFLPDRLKDGYGLKAKTLKKILPMKASVMITVDNGISSVEAVDLANENGMDVIIVDHHRVPEVQPKAYATINPKQKECGYPHQNLSAVGLVYKLTEALGEHLLSENEKNKFLSRFIDFVAIGTYQDMAPLIGENRYFVKQGLKVIEELKKTGKTNLHGINELLSVFGIRGQEINYDTLGFKIGPAINAAGRISSADKAFRLLVTKDINEAKTLAIELKQINDKRKDLTKEACDEAVKTIDKGEFENKKIILLQSSKWHQGIIGLVAQRIMDRYQKSCIVITNQGQDYYTGSARGYGDFDMGELIKTLKAYFIYQGGHNKAAGFSILDERVNDFKEALYREEKKLLDLNSEMVLYIDAIVTIKDLKNNVIRELNLLEPFGQKNPEPILALLNVKIEDLRKSKRGMDSIVKIAQGSSFFTLLAFNDLSYYKELRICETVDFAIQITGQGSSPIGKILDFQKKS